MARYVAALALCFCFFAGKAQLLWRVTGNGLEEPSYVFGTMHLGVDLSDFDDALAQSIQSCEALATEINTENAKPLKTLMMMRLPKKHRYEDFLSEKEYAFVDSVMQAKLGYELAGFKRFKPVFPAMMLMAGSIETNSSAQGGLDNQIRDTANALDLELLELESVDFQMKLITGIPLEKQFALLLQTAKEDVEGEYDIEEVVRVYKSQNLDSLEVMFSGGFGDFFSLEDFLFKRNENMTEKMVEIMESRSVFVAIGAGHLVGAKGMIALLRAKGFSVEPVALKVE